MANRLSQDGEDRIAQEAAGWVARLQSSDATEHDRRQFQRWFERDAAHREAYREFVSLWTDLKGVPVPAARFNANRRPRRTAARSFVAVGVVAVLSFVLHQMGFVDRLRADHYTGIGEVRTIKLADGSTLELNTDSAVIVRFSPAERRVQLLRGEAFFDVAKSPQRPFVVEASTLSATALGTRYGVRAPDGSVPGSVGVEAGRVEVAGGSDRAVLQAGEAAGVTAQGHLGVRQADVSNETAWRSGKLVFSNRPLREVMAALERYRHGRIVVMDNRAAEQLVSGIFDLNDTDGALRVLEENLPVSIIRVTGIMILVRSH